MKLICHASSSTRNLYCITAANGQRLLVECGVTWAKLQKALNYKAERRPGLTTNRN